MNPSPIMNHDESKVVDLSESPGRRLRVQRQNRGLEIERIAAQLHLRPAAIEALEQDRYQDLPSPVFVVGYLRNYARLLGMDPTPLLTAYRAANPAPAQPVPPRIPTPPRREIGSGHILMRLISLAVLAAVIGMLVLWWQSRGDLLSEATPAQGEPALALAPADESADPAVASAPLDAESSPPAQPTDVGAEAPPPAPPSVPDAPPAPSADLPEPAPLPADEPPATPEPAAAPPADRQVVLAFAKSSWVSVRDSSGKTILNGEVGKGEQRVLDGTPPFALVIGNAKAVSITVGGKPFDMSGVSRGGVARFKLDPASIQ